MGKATDLYLDAYLIMTVPTSYSPETNRLFDWILEGGGRKRGFIPGFHGIKATSTRECVHR